MKVKLVFTSLIVAILGSVLMMGGCEGDPDSDPISPDVVGVYPADLAVDVDINGNISASFSQDMDHTTLVAPNFAVASVAGDVAGTVTYDMPNKKAVFAPLANLTPGTVYTATITTAVKNSEGLVIPATKVWTFTTAAAGLGPSPVRLGTAGNFAILAKTGISTVPDSVITGDIGLSPAAESFMTGFSQTKATGYSTSPQVVGFMYAVDMTPPTPTVMTTAISDMETAYTDAAGRISPDELDYLSGAIGGETLVPGLYKWTSSVSIGSDVTLSGGANDVWIFQMTGDLSIASATEVLLSGGARAKNIFWQVAGEVTLGTTSHFEGIILSQTAIIMNTGATMNGRLLAQTNVALDQATITQPAQ